MPIDKPQTTAAMNTRRTFLARAAMGSALVATAGSFFTSLPAGAQGAPGAPTAPDDLGDAPFLIAAAQLETAAIAVYVAAGSTPGLTGPAQEALRTFEAQHQEVVTTLTALMDEATAGLTPLPDPTVLALRDGLGADEAAVLRSLAELEQRIAATHLWAIAGLRDGLTARSAAAVAAAGSQRATYLGRLAGEDLASLVPATVEPTGAVTGSIDAAEATIAGAGEDEESDEGGEGEAGDAGASTTTTTAAGDGTDGGTTDTDDSTPEAGN